MGQRHALPSGSEGMVHAKTGWSILLRILCGFAKKGVSYFPSAGVVTDPRDQAQDSWLDRRTGDRFVRPTGQVGTVGRMPNPGLEQHGLRIYRCCHLSATRRTFTVRELSRNLPDDRTPLKTMFRFERAAEAVDPLASIADAS